MSEISHQRLEGKPTAQNTIDPLTISVNTGNLSATIIIHLVNSSQWNITVSTEKNEDIKGVLKLLQQNLPDQKPFIGEDKSIHVNGLSAYNASIAVGMVCTTLDRNYAVQKVMERVDTYVKISSKTVKILEQRTFIGFCNRIFGFVDKVVSFLGVNRKPPELPQHIKNFKLSLNPN